MIFNCWVYNNHNYPYTFFAFIRIFKLLKEEQTEVFILENSTGAYIPEGGWRGWVFCNRRISVSRQMGLKSGLTTGEANRGFAVYCR